MPYSGVEEVECPGCLQARSFEEGEKNRRFTIESSRG